MGGGGASSGGGLGGHGSRKRGRGLCGLCHGSHGPADCPYDPDGELRAEKRVRVDEDGNASPADRPHVLLLFMRWLAALDLIRRVIFQADVLPTAAVTTAIVAAFAKADLELWGPSLELHYTHALIDDLPRMTELLRELGLTWRHVSLGVFEKYIQQLKRDMLQMPATTTLCVGAHRVQVSPGSWCLKKAAERVITAHGLSKPREVVNRARRAVQRTAVGNANPAALGAGVGAPLPLYGPPRPASP